MIKGVIPLYDEYKKYLSKMGKKIAILQLTGRIEDYLVKEFVAFVYKESHGQVFVQTNFGKAGENRIDMGLTQLRDNKRVIFGLIEAKYITNKHKGGENNALDNLEGTLASLYKQIKYVPKRKHASHDVRAKSLLNSIYGLIFASYISDINNDRDKNIYFKQLKKRAADRFRFHDLQTPQLLSVYDDIKIDYLGIKKYVSLKIGLWRAKK